MTAIERETTATLNCRAAKAHLQEVFAAAEGVVRDEDKFFDVFTKTCSIHHGHPLADMPMDVPDAQMKVHAAWFRTEGKDALLTVVVDTETGEFQFVSDHDDDWPDFMEAFFRPILGALKTAEMQAGRAETPSTTH